MSIWATIRFQVSPFRLSWLLLAGVLLLGMLVLLAAAATFEFRGPGVVIGPALLLWLLGSNILLYANGCYSCRKPPAFRSWSDARILGVPFWGIWLWPERTCSDCGADLTKSRRQLQ